MANYLVVNSSQTEATNVNAGGDDVPGESQMVVALSDAEAAAAVVAGLALLPPAADYQSRRAIARTIKYEKVQ